MLIDVPFIIKIDCQHLQPKNQWADRPVAERVMTLRFDPDIEGPLKFCGQYPPTKDSVFWEDTGDLLLSAIGNPEYRKLIARAKANPYDYCADAAEGERLQAIADAEREPA